MAGRFCIAIFSLFILIASICVCYITLLTDEKIQTPLIVEDNWWGHGPVAKDDDEPTEYRVNISESQISDLRNRLDRWRSHAALEDAIGFEYGTNAIFLKDFVKYWRNGYDWKKEERRINGYKQYMIRIEGLNVHYLHVKPTIAKGSKIEVLPLLMIHGWPGSIVEFYSSIPMLTEISQGTQTKFVFEVICPHIPGYGFSEAPKKKGFNPAEAAKLFGKLMEKLGHKQYYLQGGDWGSIITILMSLINPERVIGLHLNMLPQTGSSISVLTRWIVGAWIPSLAPGRKFSLNGLYPITEVIGNMMQETGYMHIQGTKPDTVGFGLSDSPAGLAAYILEKFSGWTDYKLSFQQQDGGLFKRFKRDELITNIMFYWWNNAITSSTRFYKEAFSETFTDQYQFEKRLVTVPTGVLACYRDPGSFMIALSTSMYSDLVTLEKADCGHFAAMETPETFVNSIKKFALLLKQRTKRS